MAILHFDSGGGSGDSSNTAADEMTGAVPSPVAHPVWSAGSEITDRGSLSRDVWEQEVPSAADEGPHAAF